MIWRDRATRLLEALNGNGTGLAITLDEVQAADVSEMRRLATQMQHLVREDLPVSLVMAGLPHSVSAVLNDKVSTFLRRAEHIDLGSVDVSSVRDSIVQTMTDPGRVISDDAADQAAQATNGYPFMIQPVGYHVWRRAGEEGRIGDESVREGIDAARVRLGNLVHAPALAGLSDVDRTFLLAMAQDDGPSRLADVAERIGRDTNYAGVYRNRLIAAGMIHGVGHGVPDFEIPYLREYLRQHAASLVAGER